MQSVILVDTSVLLNILNVPGLNQDHEAIMDEFEELVESGVNLLLPVGAVFETGNHIARLADGRQRRIYAELLKDQVVAALLGSAPWAPLQLPDSQELAEWVKKFPESAMRGIGMVDLAIIKAWERTKQQNPARRVRIWSLDKDLAGYDYVPSRLLGRE